MVFPATSAIVGDWLRLKNHSRKSPNRAIIATAFAETTTGRIAGFAGQKPLKTGEFNRASRASRANAFAPFARLARLARLAQSPNVRLIRATSVDDHIRTNAANMVDVSREPGEYVRRQPRSRRIRSTSAAILANAVDVSRDRCECVRRQPRLLRPLRPLRIRSTTAATAANPVDDRCDSCDLCDLCDLCDSRDRTYVGGYINEHFG